MRIIFTRIFGFIVEAQVGRMRKGVEDSLRSDRGSRLRGIDCDPGSGRRSRVTPRRWRGNVICRAHYGYPIRMQCYLQAQDNASCNHQGAIWGGWHRGPPGREPSRNDI